MRLQSWWDGDPEVVDVSRKLHAHVLEQHVGVVKQALSQQTRRCGPDRKPIRLARARCLYDLLDEVGCSLRAAGVLQHILNTVEVNALIEVGDVGDYRRAIFCKRVLRAAKIRQVREPLVVSARRLEDPDTLPRRESVGESLIVLLGQPRFFKHWRAVQKGREVNDVIGGGELMGDPKTKPGFWRQRLHRTDWRILADV